ncbi:MAG: DUF2909 domain-containing protein [Pelomonas sp.]|nr:DUF2909 domain-containing protein [Roseateles sp.]
MQIVIALAFVAILGALVAAGVFMLRNGDAKTRGPNMVRALALRVAVSVGLFLFILLAWHFDWIQPKGL